MKPDDNFAPVDLRRVSGEFDLFAFNALSGYIHAYNPATKLIILKPGSGKILIDSSPVNSLIVQGWTFEFYNPMERDAR